MTHSCELSLAFKDVKSIQWLWKELQHGGVEMKRLVKFSNWIMTRQKWAYVGW